MAKEEAVEILKKSGYEAKIVEGIVMILVETNDYKTFKSQFEKAKKLLEENGYKHSFGGKMICQEEMM